jgi:hypothetical protein
MDKPRPRSHKVGRVGGDRPGIEAERRGVAYRLERIFLSDKLLSLPYGILLGVTLLAILFARGLYALTLESPHLWLALAGVILTTVAATVGTGIVAFSYWKALTRSRGLRPFLLGALFLVVAVGFSVEAFAGLTWLLWKHDALGVSAPGGLSLWRVEQLFLWNVIDAVPILDIPRSLSWQRPAVTSGFWVGAMLVGFRAIVLVPAIGLGALAFQASQQEARKALRTFRDIDWTQIKKEQREHAGSSWDRFLIRITNGASWLAVIAVLVGAVAVSVLVRFAVKIGVEADSSWLRDWLDAPAHSSFTIPVIDQEIHPVWLLKVGDVVGSLVILALVIFAILFLASALLLPLAIGSLPWRIAAVLVGCSLVFLLCQAFAAVSIALVHVGLAEPTTAIAPGEEYRTSIEWFAWNAAKVAPLVDVPTTTSWTLSNPFVDPFTGGLTVLLRFLMGFIVFFPVGVLVAITIEDAGARSFTGTTQ